MGESRWDIEDNWNKIFSKITADSFATDDNKMFYHLLGYFSYFLCIKKHMHISNSYFTEK